MFKINYGEKWGEFRDPEKKWNRGSITLSSKSELWSMLTPKESCSVHNPGSNVTLFPRTKVE